MSTYYIYKVTNIQNGKIYIGKTNNFNKRKLEHMKYDINDNCIFHKALKKYGIENFIWQVVDSCETLKEINDKEKFYIEKYNTYKPNGYNMTKGGDGGSMWNAEPVVQLNLKGEFIKRFDSAGEAEKESGFCNSSVLVCCKNKNRTHKGFLFMFEDEYKANGGYKYKKPKNVCEKKVFQYSKKGEFIKEYDSIQNAATETGTNRTAIIGALKGKYKTAGGYIWKYKKEVINVLEHKANKKGTAILQMDKKTKEILNEYPSIAEAGRKLNVNYKSIHKVLDKENRSAYGFMWKTK